MEPPRDQPPRRTKRPLPGAAGEDGGGGSGSSSRDDTGFLDERDSFVERAARGGTKEEAWLGPADDDAPAAAAATKRAGKVLRKQEEDERLVDDLVSARALFEIRKRIVGLLWPGETVPRALRRLKESGQTEGRFPGAASTSTSTGAGTRGSSGRMDEATRRAFDELTDAAAELMERGDHDAYSHDREEFERAAWVYEYGRRRRASASAPQEVEEVYEAECTAATTTHNYIDMFGDGPDDAVKTAADVDAGGHTDNVNPAAEEAGEGAGVAGWDYVYDPASGYYYSSSTGYYYDAASGCYGSASTGTWFSYNDGDNGQCSSAGKEMQG